MLKWFIIGVLLVPSISLADGVVVNGVSVNDDGSANNLTLTSTNGTGITTTAVANGAKVVINAPQGATGAQGVQGITGTSGTTGIQGQAGKTGAQGATGTNGVNGTNGINGTNAAVDDSAKLVGDVALRLYDGKRVQLQLFDAYGFSFQTNEGKNMMYGMRVVFKLGKSYEERQLEKLQKQVELLEAIAQKE